MPGTKEGAAKARAKMLQKYGKDYYGKIGSKGGKAKVPKGFAMMDTEEISKFGRIGGTKSKRGPNKPKDTELGDFEEL